jgi:hypothetical protein
MLTWLNPAIRTGCLVILTMAAVLFIRHSDRATQQLASDTGRDVHRMSDALIKVTDNLGGVVGDERTAQAKQLQEFYRLLGEVRLIVTRTNKNVNGGPAFEGQAGVPGLLPSLQGLLAGFDQHVNRELLPHADETIQAMTGAVTNVGKMAQSGNDTFAAASESFKALTAQFNDPQIGLLIGNLNLTALHLASTTDHANNIIAYYDSRLTTPKGFVKTLGAGLFSLIVPGAEVYTAVAAGTASAGVAGGTAVAKRMVKKRTAKTHEHLQ